MADNQQVESSLGLKNIVDGRPPTKRLEDATACVDVVQKMRRANDARTGIVATAKRIRDRKRPYSQKALQDQGRGWYPNINFGDAESDLANAVSPYYDIFSEVPRYFNCKTSYGDSQQKVEWSEIISEEFHDLLQECEVFDFEIQKSQIESISFGYGPCCFENQWDFRFKAFPGTSILVPQSASTNPDLWEICAVPDDSLVGVAWNAIKNESAAKAAGWDVEAVKKSISNAHEKTMSTTSTGEDFIRWADRLRRNDIWWTYDSQYIELAHVLVKELDGSGISHAIVDLKSGDNEYLYYQKSVYQKFSQFITVFPFDIGDGTLYSTKGLIVKNADHYQVQDRLKCQIIAGAFIGSSLVLKAGTETQDNEIELVQIGPVTRIPASCTIEQTNLKGLLEGPLGVDRYFEQHRLSNMGQYKRINDPSGAPLTATGETLQAQNKAVLSKSSMNRYYLQMDKLGKEIYRRVINPELTRHHPGAEFALEFRQKCLDRGVPMRALDQVYSVRFYRNAGQGSADVRELQLSKITAMMPLYSEETKQKILRMSTATIMGQDIANDWVPKAPDSTVTDQQALATQETASFRVGIMPIVTGTQDHVAHIGVHSNDMMVILDNVNNGKADPVQSLQILISEDQHNDQHFMRIEGDNTRKQQVAALGEMIGTIKNAIKKLQKNVDDMLKAQQQAQAEAQQMELQAQMMGMGLSPEEKLGMAEIESKERLGMAKLQSDANLKATRTQHNMALKTATTEQNMALKDATTQQDLAINDVTTAQKVKQNEVAGNP